MCSGIEFGVIKQRREEESLCWNGLNAKLSFYFIHVTLLSDGFCDLIRAMF